MDEFMMIINDCYPVSAYKKHYLTARCILNEAQKLEPANDDDVEKAMWICALLDDLKQVPVGRFEHTFDYKSISFDSAEFIRETFPQKEHLDIKLDDQLVYIGKSKNMLERVASHYVGIKQGSELKYRIIAEA